MTASNIKDYFLNPVSAESKISSPVLNLQTAVVGDAARQPCSVFYQGNAAAIVAGGSDSVRGYMEAEQAGLRGRLVICPHCEAQVQVPEAEEPAAAEADAAEADAAPAAESGDAVAPGRVIRNIYKVEQKLGDSSLGEIYLASVVTDGRKVQLEVLDAGNQEAIDRLSSEIDLLASLEHPNIVHAFDAGQDGNLVFLATNYEDGNTLQQHLKEGSIDEQPALTITKDIAQALRHAWAQRKILHRDIKPANIFVTDGLNAKLMGFGIAKSREGQSLGLTGVGFTIGTPEYMSPEQIKAAEDIDFRSDIYGLGCVLYEMVTGELPFAESAPILLMQKHMDEDPEPANIRNSKVSAATTELIQWMMMKDRSQRPQSWDELIQRIDGILSGQVTGTASALGGVAPVPVKAGAGPKKKKGCGVGVAAVVSLGFAAIYLLTR